MFSFILSATLCKNKNKKQYTCIVCGGSGGCGDELFQQAMVVTLAMMLMSGFLQPWWWQWQ